MVDATQEREERGMVEDIKVKKTNVYQSKNVSSIPDNQGRACSCAWCSWEDPRKSECGMQSIMPASFVTGHFAWQSQLVQE